MFKLKIDLEKGHIQAAGSAVEIVADLLFAINEIHALMARRDKATAELFREALIVGVNAQDSPLFNGKASPGVSFIVKLGSKKGAE